jgi:metal transporter CNNM
VRLTVYNAISTAVNIPHSSFSEVIPQSVCTRYGLAVGATMAPFVKVLLWTLVRTSSSLPMFCRPNTASPRASWLGRWLNFLRLFSALTMVSSIVAVVRVDTTFIKTDVHPTLTELKELIQIHSHDAAHGGDLKHDTVAIIGATLDLQEKVVQHAMTPIDKVFMLSIDAVLDFETLRKICVTGHSRVPVYEEVDAPYGMVGAKPVRMMKVKKIVGILLVKQCVLLDPSDAVPVRKIPLNKVATVPMNEPLLGILDRFQEGRSHMALVTRFSHEKAASVKKVVKKSLTQRIKDRVTGDSSDSSSDEDEPAPKAKKGSGSDTDGTTLRGRSTRSDSDDVEATAPTTEKEQNRSRTSFQIGLSGREQSMPADAILAKADAEEFLQSLDPTVAPLGIITLEDVVEGEY